MIADQLPLLGRSEPGFDPEFRGLRRLDLGAGAWLDRLPGWLQGHETVFRALLETMRWEGGSRVMYDRVVDVPRLTASIPADGPGHPAVFAMAEALSRRYGTTFDRLSLNLYRDGRDGVAWHGDRVLRERHNALVGTVSVGEPRKFLLRPAGGGPSMTFNLGWGDLVMMGGECQRLWEHCVPKQRRAGPRISIMFRRAEGSDG